jgi:hypothetical protein
LNICLFFSHLCASGIDFMFNRLVCMV